jgi:hypothetical protein
VRLVLTAIIALVLAPAAAASWPLAPIDQQHPIRAGFLDVRELNGVFGFHKGADVVVDETVCSPIAPPNGCRYVFAMTGHHVWARTGSSSRCGLVRVGRYGYGHVIPRVRRGQRIRPGQFIGWTCRGLWHVHISESLSVPCGRDRPQGLCHFLDPLRAGARLANPDDTTGPVFKSVAFVNGYVDARIEDPGWTGNRLYNDLPPARIDVNGRTLIDDVLWPLPAVAAVYAPEAYRNMRANLCGAARDPALLTCEGQYIFRLGAFASGEVVSVTAWDSAGNASGAEIAVP